MAQLKKAYKDLHIKLDRYVFEELDYFSKDQKMDKTQVIERLLDKSIEEFYLKTGQEKKLEEMRAICSKVSERN